MWFKQAKLFTLITPIPYDLEKLASQLEPLAFTPCLPSFPSTYGWISPVEDDPQLVRGINNYMLICLQLEEKILPATVVRQELHEKIKFIEARRDKKVGQKEKYVIKDEITRALLPRAFSKLTKIYAYIDVKNHLLVVDNANTAKLEVFMDLFKKSCQDITLQPAATLKPTPILTRWLLQQNYPRTLTIEKSCVLTDPNQQSRILRCQGQDLFTNNVQSLARDNLEVKQLALSWQDRIHFTLVDDFSLRSIKFQDSVLAAADEAEPENKQQQMDADFLIMTDTLSGLLTELLELFAEKTADTTLPSPVTA